MSFLISLKLATEPLQGLASHAFRTVWHLAKTELEKAR